jgi:serine/threonine protein kinase
MLYALPPFYSQNQALMFERIKLNEVKFPENPVTSPEAKDIIKKLLIKDPAKRLGTVGDINDLKNHPWFKGFDWAALLAKKMRPPFTPKVSGEDWINNFDEEFTKESKPLLLG